jgi:acetyl-CoA C-acetyltransferase
MREVFVVAGRRTPFGKFLGSLSAVSAVDLGATAIKAAIDSAGVEPRFVEYVAFGQVLRHTYGQHPARLAALKAGIPFDAFTALNMHQACGSGLAAVFNAYLWIASGQADSAVAGGMESMTLAPHLLTGLRGAKKFGDFPAAELVRHFAEHGEQSALEVLIHDGLADWTGVMMGGRADLIAREFGIARRDMDEFALRSHHLAFAAAKNGLFAPEIVPVVRPDDGTAVVTDEGVRGAATLDGLAKLAPAFEKDGRVTAGNASQISDGAGALLLASGEFVRAHGLKPLARIVAFDASPADSLPHVLVAPIVSIPRVLKRAGLSVNDIDLFEINEAFASSTLAVQRTLKIPFDAVNAAGGAIAIGHPVGASGARLLMHLVCDLARTQKEFGLASLCLGGAEAVSMIVQRV